MLLFFKIVGAAMKSRLIVCLLLSASAAASVTAQTLKPGLWELSNKMKSSDPKADQAMEMAMKQLASMPPEQRKQMEAMLSQHGKTGMPSMGADGGMRITTCITPEMAAKNEFPVTQEGSCTSNKLPVPGGLKVSFNCTQPPSSGEGEIRFISDSAYSMTMTITSQRGGKPDTMTVTSNGKLLGACPAKPK